MSKSRASDFLANMKAQTPEASVSPKVSQPATPTAVQGRAEKPTGRAGLKHIGGYFEDDTVEKVAMLRARLKLDNSALLKLAIEDLYSKEKAKRAFAD